ncbi:hybrid sensor histidine kinase/response regulator [Asticcacaulis biprosthecium]|nr:hybrid sensor histidine kinase/response regulator [Asticcacaulis biprosthecium]
MSSLASITADAARGLLGAADSTFILRDGHEGHCVEQSGPNKKWKGIRFPLEGTVTGSVILSGVADSIADIRQDSRIPSSAYDPAAIQSILVVPIRRSQPLGAIVVNWNELRLADEDDIAILHALADITSVAWENVRLFEALQDKVKGLEAQRARIEAQHESLEVFSRALAHDLREPVRTVRAFSELIACGEDPPQMRDTYFELIHKAADRMAMLVDTVFQYTQLDDPSRLSKRAVDMNQTVTAVTGNLAQLIRERGAIVTAVDLPTVDAHAAHMMQLVQNLVSNALHHGPVGVEVRIDATDLGDHWQFSVSDNGPGLARNDVERIFLPFKRLNLNEEGAGLGLSICRKVMALHEGRIWCECGYEGGARFLFTLPKSGAGTPGATANVNRGSLMETTGRRLANVLLVDDRDADLELTRVLLQVRDRLQFNLIMAKSGKEALERLRQAGREQEPVDLLLLDINMPGMSGFEMLEELRKDTSIPPVAVVMCSGSTYEDDLKRAESLGAAGYMVKPPSLDQLKPMLAVLPDLHLDQEGRDSRLTHAA